MSESLITKKAIVEALKEVCMEKPFDKVSVADITRRCGLNRQTFYYHFQDKYELLSWIYYNENFIFITRDINLDNWDEKILEMLDLMLENKKFYMNTIHEQEHTFQSYLFEMSKTMFEEAIEVLDVRKKLTEEERSFHARFFAYGICGLTIEWVEKGMKEPPVDVASDLKKLVENSKQIAYLRHEGGNP